MTKAAISTVAKRVGLPVGTATAFVAWAQDAGNWSGNPYTQGNVDFGKSTQGFVKRLVEAGFVNNHDGEDGAYLSFTPAGIEAARQFGVDLSYLVEETIHTPAEEAAPAIKVCKKDASHGEHRVVKSGSYCKTCDDIVAAGQKAARHAAKEAAAA